MSPMARWGVTHRVTAGRIVNITLRRYRSRATTTHTARADSAITSWLRGRRVALTRPHVDRHVGVAGVRVVERRGEACGGGVAESAADCSREAAPSRDLASQTASAPTSLRSLSHPRRPATPSTCGPGRAQCRSSCDVVCVVRGGSGRQWCGRGHRRDVDCRSRHGCAAVATAAAPPAMLTCARSRGTCRTTSCSSSSSTPPPWATRPSTATTRRRRS